MADSHHRITRADGQSDALTRQLYDSYDAAYDELERYYGDLCCSDDERIDYTISSPPHHADAPEP